MIALSLLGQVAQLRTKWRSTAHEDGGPRAHSRSIDRLSKSTKELITAWKIGKTAATAEEGLEGRDAVVKRANTIRLGIKIAVSATAILGAIAMTALGIGFAFALTRGISNLSSGFFMVTTRSLLLGGAAAVTAAVLNRSETLRRERALTDRDFKEFLTEYLTDAKDTPDKDTPDAVNSRFLPTRSHLVDRKLHEIYLQWQGSLQRILARCS